MLEETNPEEDNNLNRKIISILQTETRRLIRKRRETNEDSYPSQPNTKPNITPPNKARPVSISTRILNVQNKPDSSLSPGDQVNQGGEASPAAVPIEEDTHDSSSYMPVDDTGTGCTESAPVVDLPGVSHQSIRFGDTSLALAEGANDVKQELQDVARVINEAERIVLFVGAGISTNCGIPVSIHLVPLAVFRLQLSRTFGLRPAFTRQTKVSSKEKCSMTKKGESNYTNA